MASSAKVSAGPLRTPRPSRGYNPVKLSTPYYAGLDEPGKPTMAQLIEIAKRAKARKLAGLNHRPQGVPQFKKPTVQPLKRKAPKPSTEADAIHLSSPVKKDGTKHIDDCSDPSDHEPISSTSSSI